jgi:hypothetical protein
MQVGALFAAIGAGGMLGTAGNFTAYLACKCIGGVGLGHIIAAAVVYGAECTIASKRGMLLALYNVGLGFGNAAAAAVCWGSSSYTHSNLAWQIPIICQIPLSFILGFGACCFPESPRWLLTKGREEAAKRSFAWFYAKPADHPDVLLQVQDVQRHIDMERLYGSTTSWTETFRGQNVRRTGVSCLNPRLNLLFKDVSTVSVRMQWSDAPASHPIRHALRYSQYMTLRRLLRSSSRQLITPCEGPYRMHRTRDATLPHQARSYGSPFSRPGSSCATPQHIGYARHACLCSSIHRSTYPYRAVLCS